MEKIAIVKMGAQSIKLSLLDVAPNGYYNLFDEVTETIKLENSIESAGLITANIISDTLTVLKLFRKICDANNVSKTYAVCESFLKKAKNQKSFIDEVYNNTGFSFTIYSVEEEIKNIYRGVTSLIDVSKAVCLYVTPSQTHIIMFNRRTVLNVTTIATGYCTLADQFADVLDPEEKMNAMTSEFKNLATGVNINAGLENEPTYIGAGMVFENLGRLARRITKCPLEIENNYVVTRQVIDSVFDAVKVLDLDKTKKLKGISEERADSVASGMAIVKALSELLGVSNLSVSANAFDEGIINQYLPTECPDKTFAADMLAVSLDTIRTFYDRELSNTQTVYNLALLLFKQLKVIHKLPRVYIKPLRIAASMYNCGTRIGFDNFANKSFEIILNSRINGASQRDILIAAFACKAQNLDNISLAEFMKYKDILTEEDFDAIRKLGIIIKLACSLDKSRMGSISDIVCDILGDSIIMKTVSKSDSSFDVLQAQKVSADFKRVFKKTLEVI